jgi:Skp family chaperone for outer membrane proteins
MRISFLALAVALIAPISAGYAASCSKDIDAMQARFDARLEAIAGSIAKAEEKLGELNQHLVRNVRRALNRARAADARGNFRRCESEVAKARRALGP